MVNFILGLCVGIPVGLLIAVLRVYRNYKKLDKE